MKNIYVHKKENTTLCLCKSIDRYAILVLILVTGWMFVAGSAWSQTVNKQLYIKSGTFLDRVVPTNALPQASTILVKQIAAIDATSTANSGAASGINSPMTFAHTTGTNNYRMMIVSVVYDPENVYGNGSAVNSVTYGGVALTKLGEVVNGLNVKVELYYLKNPASGTANVVINWTPQANLQIIAGVTTLYNADQTDPFGTVAKEIGSEKSSTLTVLSESGDFIFDAIGNAKASITANAGQTEIFNVNTNKLVAGSSRIAATAVSTTMTWAIQSKVPFAHIGVAIKGQSNEIVFNQSPVMCSPLIIKAGQPITIVTHAAVTSGTNSRTNVPVTATLKHGSTNVITISSALNAGLGTNGTTGTLTWTGTIPSDYTVPAGGNLVLELSNDYSPASFRIDYDAVSKPSRVILPTSTYININSLNVYNALNPGGSTFTQSSLGVPNYIRAVVSDPFGFNDINGLDLVINGAAPIAATSVATSGCTRTFEYVWTPTAAGTYDIQATAKEGTEGTVSHAVTFNNFLVKQPSLTIATTKISPASGPFTLNDNIIYNIAITNTGLSPITTLPLQDLFNASCLQYVSASIAPSSIATGVITWNNLAGTPLAPGTTLNITVTLKVIGNCDPTANTASVDGAKDNLNNKAAIQTSAVNISIEQPPVANADSYFIQASIQLPVLDNDSDPDVVGFLSANTELYNVSILTPPAKGSAIVKANKNIQFDPAGGIAMSENNTVTFVYRVSEIAPSTYYSDVTVTVLFSAVNSPPTAIADIASTTTEKPVILNVLANDADPDGILQAPTVAVPPLFGTVLVNSNKTITYTPYAGFEGTDVFTYKVCDDGFPTPATCSTATVTINVIFSWYVCGEGVSTLSVTPVTDATNYSWTLPAGATVTSPFTGILPNPQTITPDITVNWSGVSPGSYNICTTAINECGPGAVKCTPLVVNKLQLSLAPTHVSCNGAGTGSINLTVSGAVAPYTYVWSRQEGGYSASVEDIDKLSSGTYDITVTDKFGCTATGSATISQPISPLSISGIITAENPWGSANGMIDITVTGGNPGFAYTWSNGSTVEDISSLAGGSYTINTTDANGCSTAKSFTVNRIGGPPIIISITKTDVPCFGGSTGSVDLEVIGGTTPYTYAWTGPVGPFNTQDLTGRAAGIYNVTVTDNMGITANASITISQPAAALSASRTFVNVSCNGNTTGSIDVTVNGGTTPYTYLWSDGITTRDLSGLVAGSYNLTVTDKNGCTTTTTATITQPVSLVISGTVINSNCNPGNSGAIDISVIGGSPAYNYLWSNGATTQNLNSLTPGIYSVTVTDLSGCKVFQTFSVGNSCIGAAKTISGNTLNNGDGTYTLTYRIKLQNQGSIALSNVQTTEDLASTFSGATSFAVNAISSGSLTVNNSFNGNSDKNLLTTPLGTLMPGDEAFINLTVTVTPGTNLGDYNNSATVTATDSIGLIVSDLTQNGNNVDPDNDGNPGNNSITTPLTFIESPMIGVAKELVGMPMINPDGSYNLLFTMRLHNYGNVPLKNIQVADNLLITFGASASLTVLSITSTDMAVNGAYNGNTNSNLLLGTDVMAVNEINTIQLNIKITPSAAGPFNNTALGTGTSTGGTVVTDLSQNGVNPDPDNDDNPTNNNVPTPIVFPEHPEIGAAKQLVGLPVNNHDGTFSLTYEIRVKNTGDVNLKNVQVTDDLTATFPGKPVTVTNINSSYFAVNNSYNGTNNLLAGTDNLAVGAQHVISLTVKVTPGINLGPYNNNATAIGQSIFNAPASDISTNGIDVDPENDGTGNNSLPTPVSFTEAPQMGVAKAVSVPVNNHDGTYSVTYTIKIQNTGDVPINNVQVTDNLSTALNGAAGFVVQGNSSDDFTVNPMFNGAGDQNLLSGTNTLAYATSGTITIIVKVTPGTKMGVYSNLTTGTATSPVGTSLTDVSTNGSNVDPDNDGNPYNNSIPTPVSFSENPQIGVAKRIMAAPTDNGNGTYTFTYEIRVQNIGDVTLNNVQLVEDLSTTYPSPATFTIDAYSITQQPVSTILTTNGSFNGSANANLLNGPGTLRYNEFALIRLTVTINPGTIGGPYNNTAIAFGTSSKGTFVLDNSQDGLNVDPNNNGVATDDNDPTPVTFFENPKIGIAKSLVSVVANLDGTNDITLLLTIENFGDVELKNLEIFDNIVTQFTSASPTDFAVSQGSLFADNSWNGTAASNILTPGQNLGIGQTGTVYINFRVTPGITSTINNTATASAAGTLGGTTTDNSTDGTNPDPDNNNNPGEQVPTPVNFKYPDLSVTKTNSPDPVIAGENVTYTISVTNNGVSTANGVTVNDVLPNGLTFISAATLTGTWTTPNWSVGTLINGASASLTIIAKINSEVSDGSVINNTAIVSGTLPDPISANNTATASTIVNAFADLAIVKTVDNSTPNVGRTVVFTLTASNTGPSNATGVNILDLLPPGYTYISNTPSKGTYTSGTGIWSLGNLNNGASEYLTITATVNTSGPYANTAAIIASEPDSTPENNSSTIITVPVPLDFGDAPDSYGTILADNGARSNLLNNIRIGGTNDGEVDGKSSVAADGDGAD